MPRRTPKPRKSQVALALGRIIREHRESINLTQESFAERVQLSKNFVGNMERGEYEASVNTLARIAATFDKKASDLIREAGY